VTVSAAEAITKLQTLSPERANKVFATVDDLAELEALENAADLRDARESLAEVESGSGTVSYADLRHEAS